MWYFDMKKYLLSLILILLPTLSLAEMAVIVHPNNPLNTLTQKQVQRLFLGRMLMFPNSKTKVDSVDQDEDSEIYRRFYRDVIKISASKLKRYRAYYLFSGKGTLPSPTMNHSVVAHVAEIENAISYVPMTEVNESVKVVYTH